MALYQYMKRYGFQAWFRQLIINLRQWFLEDQANQGLGGPPNNWAHLKTFDVQRYIRDGHDYAFGYNARFNNDAHEIWIGTREIDRGQTHDRWAFHCSTQAFRRIAIWYLWRWAWGEWFGLRRKLFYWDLHRRVQSR